MHAIGTLLLRYKKLTSLFSLLIIVYIAQDFLIKPDPATLQKYHLTVLQDQILGLTIILPYVIIWVIALVGYLRLRTYTLSLGRSKDAAAFQLITTSVFWFTLWLPLSPLTGVLGSYSYGRHPSMLPTVIRLENYANLIFLVPAFIYMYLGSLALLKISRSRLVNPTVKTAIGFIVFSALYTFITLQDSIRRVAPDHVTPATYYLPDWLIILTIVVPRLICWFIGLLAVQNILQYRQKISGILYRRALQDLAIGLAGVVVLIIVLRCAQSLANVLSHVGLGVLLLIIYLLLTLMSVGYVLIGKGARHLQDIEEL